MSAMPSGELPPLPRRRDWAREPKRVRPPPSPPAPLFEPPPDEWTESENEFMSRALEYWGGLGIRALGNLHTTFINHRVSLQTETKSERSTVISSSSSVIAIHRSPYQINFRQLGTEFVFPVSKYALSTIIHEGTITGLPFEAHLTFRLDAHFVFPVGIDAVVSFRTHPRLLIDLANF